MKKNDTFKKSKFIRICISFGKRIQEDNINSYAASCAFFFFLSLIPMLVLLCSVLPFTPLKEADIVLILNKELPNTLGNLLTSMISEAYDKTFGTLSIAAITTLWTAGKGVNALITGLNVIEHVSPKRNTIVMRLFASLYTLLFLISLLIFLILMVYGNIAKDVLVGYFPKLYNVFEILVKLRSVITILLMTLMFMVLYTVLPSTKLNLRSQFFGALFASISWTVFSFIFSLFVENYGAFSMYGSFATIIVLCFWLYSCIYLVFIGANLNKYFRPVLVVVDKRFRERNHVRAQSESLEE